MVGQRLEVRLDTERQHKLATILAERRIPVSEVVRQFIDEAYEEIARARRIEAARRIAAMEIEDVPDPETIKRQSESSYGVPDIY